ncbi:MAG: PH domain-containing protein [Salinimicrobium sp.]
MSDFDFSVPQRQSKVGLVLIFATSLYRLIRNLWVLLIYFLVRETDPATVLMLSLGTAAVLLLLLGYSIVSYLRFKFHIDEGNKEFVLEKGVFESDVTNIPFGKIQQVNFKRSILQRIIGVYSVVIDTAGSGEKEVEIKALSEEKANALADRLMDLKREETGIASEEENIEEAEQQSVTALPQWEYKVPFLTLIKIGLTSNYLRGVGIIVAFYFTLREQFMLEDTLPGRVPQSVFFSSGSFIFIIFLLLIGMLITIGETLIKYYDLNLKKFRDSLQVEMGLRNNTRVNLKASRIQLLQVLTNPLQKKLGLHKLKIALASSRDDVNKSKIVVPGLPQEIVTQVKKYFFGSEIERLHKITPNKLLLFRKISRGMIPLFLGLVLGFFYREFFSFGTLGLLASIYLVLLAVFNYFYYKSLRLYISNDFLVKHSGIWVRKKQFLEMFRLQALSVKQPLWYKRRGIVNLVFHSAAGDIHFNMVKEEQVRPLLNYLLYKIESTEKAWM